MRTYVQWCRVYTVAKPASPLAGPMLRLSTTSGPERVCNVGASAHVRAGLCSMQASGVGYDEGPTAGAFPDRWYMFSYRFHYVSPRVSREIVTVQVVETRRSVQVRHRVAVSV